MKKGLKKKLFFVGIFLISLLSIIYAYVPYIVVEMKNPIIITAKNYFHKETINHKINLTHYDQKIHFKTDDNINLTATIFLSKSKSIKANIILLHGIRSSKESFMPVIDFLIQNNFNAIALDLRAHGESEGEFCTFGYLEKQDVKKLVDYLIKTKNLKAPFGIWGHSLGGAIALQTLAMDKDLKFGIIESSYSNYKTIFGDYVKHYTGSNFDFIDENLIRRSSEIANFNPKKVNPSDYCSKILQPVLIIHGTKDKKIDIKYDRINFEKLISKNKKFIAVEGAGHNDIWSKGGKKLFENILEFLNRVCL